MYSYDPREFKIHQIHENNYNTRQDEISICEKPKDRTGSHMALTNEDSDE